MKALFLNKNRENATTDDDYFALKRKLNYEQKVALFFVEKLSLERVTAKIRRELV